MELPKKINPDNLIETIVEIRMKPLCPSELWAGMISSAVLKLGYQYIPVPSVNVRLDKNGKMAVSVESGKESMTSGIFVHDSIRFVMQGDRLSFNCNMGHYVGWKIYRDEIKKVLGVILNCGVVESFNRVQIRYISEYPDIDIIDFIDGTISVNSKFALLKNQEIKLNKVEENVKVFVSLKNKEKRNSPMAKECLSSLFDVNVYENFDDSSDIEDVIKTLDKVHDVEKETFFGLLKEEFVQSLNPEY